MTLNTSIRVTTPMTVDEAHDLFTYCQSLVGPAYALVGEHYHGKGWMNEPDQGLPAWLMLEHNDGEPIADEIDEECGAPPAGYAEVSFDTAYGYQGEHGESCTQLHALLVVQVTSWLAVRRYGWAWQNEYTGEWHDTVTGEPMAAFIGNGEQAREWFTTQVVPLIRGMGGKVE
jgi:hypothetical protein